MPLMYKAPEQKGFSIGTLTMQSHHLSAGMHSVLPLNWEFRAEPDIMECLLKVITSKSESYKRCQK